MPKTLTVAEAINMLGVKYPKLHPDGVGARLADEVIAFIWNRYPWRNSLATLPPFYPIREIADYGPPLYAVPTDFKGLHEAWLRRNTGERIEPSLIIKPSVSISVVPDTPTAIAYQPEISSFRLHPRPSFSGPEIWIEGIYKTLHTKVTSENMNSYVFPWDDEYFQVFREGLKWKYKADLMDASDVMNQFAVFRAFVDEMAAAEGLHSGVMSVAPLTSLELGG